MIYFNQIKLLTKYEVTYLNELQFSMLLPNKETLFPYNGKDKLFHRFSQYFMFRLLFSQILYISNANQFKAYSFLYQQFYKNKSLVFGKKLRKSQEQNQACCPTEHKNKVPRLAILKLLRIKHQNSAWRSLILYCLQTSSTLTLQFNIAKLFIDHI